MYGHKQNFCMAIHKIVKFEEFQRKFRWICARLRTWLQISQIDPPIRLDRRILPWTLARNPGTRIQEDSSFPWTSLPAPISSLSTPTRTIPIRNWAPKTRPSEWRCRFSIRHTRLEADARLTTSTLGYIYHQMPQQRAERPSTGGAAKPPFYLNCVQSVHSIIWPENIQSPLYLYLYICPHNYR